jgi:hypothetical protein
MVSRGYEARPAPIVTPQPNMKDAKKLFSRAPTRTTGSTVCEQHARNAVQSPTKRIVDTEVETTVDNDTNNGGNETAIKTKQTVRSKRLFVDINQAIELTGSSTLGSLGVIRETGTSIIEGVHEKERGCTSGTSRCDVSGEPFPIAVILFEAEKRLEVILCFQISTVRLVVLKRGITEGKVQGLGWEVTDDIGGVTAP